MKVGELKYLLSAFSDESIVLIRTRVGEKPVTVVEGGTAQPHANFSNSPNIGPYTFSTDPEAVGEPAVLLEG